MQMHAGAYTSALPRPPLMRSGETLLLPSSGSICDYRATIMLDASRPPKASTRKGFGTSVRLIVSSVTSGPASYAKHASHSRWGCLTETQRVTSRHVVLCSVIEAHPQHAR